MIDAAVRDLLAADATLVAMLGTYGGQPAIFVQGHVPATFDRGTKPYFALRDTQAGPYLDGDRDFAVAPVEVLALALDAGDAAAVEAAAWRARALLDGASIAPAGYAAAGTVVDSGPESADPDDLTFGRLLRVSVGIIKE